MRSGFKDIRRRRVQRVRHPDQLLKSDALQRIIEILQLGEVERNVEGRLAEAAVLAVPGEPVLQARGQQLVVDELPEEVFAGG